MEIFNSLAASIASRAQSSYVEQNENINKLIDELGQKLQKDLVILEEKVLLEYKEELQNAQEEYKQLQRSRNDEIIKQKVLQIKNDQERIFHQQEMKSLEMNKLYDKIKLDLKKNMEYEHQLQLQIRFLTKQVAAAKKKSQILDLQIQEYQEERPPFRESIEQKLQTIYLPSIKKSTNYRETYQFDKSQSLKEKRTRNKIQVMKEYLEIIGQQQTTIEKIVGKFEFQNCNSEVKKAKKVQEMLNDKQFKKYLYKVMFRKREEAKRSA